MPEVSKILVRRIGLEKAQRRRKQLLSVDARSATSLARNPQQVPEAIHVPAKQLSEGVERLPKDRAVVTYCT